MPQSHKCQGLLEVRTGRLFLRILPEVQWSIKSIQATTLLSMTDTVLGDNSIGREAKQKRPKQDLPASHFCPWAQQVYPKCSLVGRVLESLTHWVPVKSRVQARNLRGLLVMPGAPFPLETWFWSLEATLSVSMIHKCIFLCFSLGMCVSPGLQRAEARTELEVPGIYSREMLMKDKGERKQ